MFGFCLPLIIFDADTSQVMTLKGRLINGVEAISFLDGLLPFYLYSCWSVYIKVM